MLPFEPESGVLLAKRYPAAVERVYDLHEMWDKRRPGLNRQHVFDFEDGLRLIVSRERHDSDEVMLHWSASIDEGHLQRPPFQDVQDFTNFVMEHMSTLWDEPGGKQGNVHVKSSAEGIIHFFMVEDSAPKPGKCRPGDEWMN
jgi:hypothetical protein